LNSFKQLVVSPTRIMKDTSTFIDVILTTNNKNIASRITTPLSLSDHDLVGGKAKQQKISSKNNQMTKFIPCHIKHIFSQSIQSRDKSDQNDLSYIIYDLSYMLFLPIKYIAFPL